MELGLPVQFEEIPMTQAGPAADREHARPVSRLFGDEIAGTATAGALALIMATALGIAFPYAPLFPMAFQVAPFLAVIQLILALVLAVFRRPVRAILTGISAVALVVYLIALVTPAMATATGDGGAADQMKLISFNILGTNPNGAEVATFLVDADADVVFVLEAEPIFDHLRQLRRAYPYQVGCEKRNACDSLILSRHPLSNVSVRSLSHFSPNRSIMATIEIGGRSLTLLNVHVTKPYSDAAEEEEIAALAASVRKIEGTLVVAGDFNAAPWSPPLERPET